MKHPKNISFIVIAFFSTSLHSRDVAGPFALKKDQTISQLLYYELNLRPIYSRDRLMMRVLRYNNLSLEEAKKLPVGYEIMLPPDMIHVEGPEVSEVIPEEISKESPKLFTEVKVSHLHSFTIGGGLFFYNGKSKTLGDFSSSGPLTDLRYRYSYRRDSWEVRPDLQLQLNYLTGSQFSEVNPTYGLGIAGLKHFETLSLGMKFRYRNNFYLTSKTGAKEELVNGFVPGIGLVGGVSSQDYFAELELGMNLSSQISGQDLKSTPFIAGSIHKKLNKGWRIGPEFNFEKREPEDFDQNFLVLTLLLSGTL